MRVIELAIVKSINTKFADAHTILRQSSRLVRADHRRGTHRLTSMHLPHQVIGFEHTTHTQRQAEGDAHWKTFRHCHHDQGNGNHQGVEQITQKIKPFERLRFTLDEIHQHSEADDHSSDDVAGYGDGVTKLIQLFIQWGLDLIIDLSARVDLAPFCGIANTFHDKDAVAVDDRTATAHVV